MKFTNRIILSGFCLWFVLLSASCKSPKEEPAIAAKAFYEALAKKDYDMATEFATKDSKTMIGLIKSMSEMSDAIEAADGEVEKLKTAVYTTEKIDGDKATVKVKMKEQEEKMIILKKEEGVWKVALDKESLQDTLNENIEEKGKEIDSALRDVSEKLEQVDDSLGKALQEAGKVLQSDSVKQALEKAGDALKKTGEALKEAGKQ